MSVISLGDALRHHADRLGPDAVAITYADAALTWAELDARANRRARLFQSLGVKPDDFVTISLPNATLFHETVFAVWKCGATPNVVSAKLPAHEFRAIVELVQPRLVVGASAEVLPGFQCVAGSADASGFAASQVLEVAPRYWKAMTSGGSTGRPKVIVDHLPGQVDLDSQATQAAMQMTPDMVVLNPGPLYHNAPFMMSHMALAIGCPVIGMTRFDPEEALRLIEAHRVNWVTLVPAMMHRIWSLPPEVRERYDVSSLQVVWHMAAPCPAWLKEAWIDWLGGEKIWELYGGTEAIGGTVIRGDEWLAKRGSVGRLREGAQIKLLGEDGQPTAAGEIGEIYFKVPEPEAMPYHYLGAEPKEAEPGWQSLGDLGLVDEDGYLFLADRRTDLILRGGANIYPAEIEAALDAHPQVGSSVAVGLPCEELGQRVHAIVQPRPGVELDLQALHSFVADRLARYKLPESYELADAPLRDDAGKVRRSALRDERVAWLADGRAFQLRPHR